MQFLIDSTFSWEITLAVIALTTLVIFLAGRLELQGAAPIKQYFNYSESEYKLLKIWLALATVFGIVLPALTFLIFFQVSELRLFFSLYFFVVFVQLLSEYILSRLFFQTIVVTVGSLYTALRIWQLWSVQKLMVINTELSMGSLRFVIAVLWVMLLFWLSNIIVNFVIYRKKLV
ncbi:MAG: hypothetical protein KME64_28565 [Scytonematopsis contorta HA4267-MV1]|jgi:hypothetical protein|nr:hypothetical protein [Scytonematopsis contorta HA4267-MV1]